MRCFHGQAAWKIMPVYNRQQISSLRPNIEIVTPGNI
jgi:hypothetical protein